MVVGQTASSIRFCNTLKTEAEKLRLFLFETTTMIKLKNALFRVFYLLFMMIPLMLLLQGFFVIFLPELVASIIAVTLAYFIADFVSFTYKFQKQVEEVEREQNEGSSKGND